MRVKILAIIAFLLIVNNCFAMWVSYFESDGKETAIYIPANHEDELLIQFWSQNGTLFQRLSIQIENGEVVPGYLPLDAYGKPTAGFIPINFDGHALEGLYCCKIATPEKNRQTAIASSCRQEYWSDSLQSYPTEAGTLSTAYFSHSEPVFRGNPSSFYICIDSLHNRCFRDHCSYRHLTKEQAKSVTIQRNDAHKHFQTKLCTKGYGHNMDECPFLHIN